MVADERRYRLLSAGVVSPPTGNELADRLADGYRGFTSVLEQHHPDVLVIEEVFASQRFPRAALQMAHLRGVLYLAAGLAGVQVRSLTATTVKQRLTGNGHASKDQVQRMVFQLCEISAPGLRSDVTDAVALAIAGLHQASASSQAALYRG